MQNDVTSRIEAENVLTGLSEGQVLGETGGGQGGECLQGASQRIAAWGSMRVGFRSEWLLDG